MPLWAWLAIAGLTGLLALVAGGWLVRRNGLHTDRLLIRRIERLSLRAKLRLTWAILRDPRVPLAVRAIPAVLVLYLALPFDIVPDFLPVIGQLDDVLVLVIGVGLLLRFTPPRVLEGHVAVLETEAAARLPK